MLFRSAVILCSDAFQISGRGPTNRFRRNANHIFRCSRYFRTRSGLNNSEKESSALFQLAKPFAFTFVFSSTCIMGSAVWQHETFKRKREDMLKSIMPRFRGSQHNFNNNNNPLLKWWYSRSEADVLFTIIAVTCGVVFLVAQYVAEKPKLFSLFSRYFISIPNPSNPGQVCPSLLLSAFCHLSLIHTAFNLIALESFVKISVDQLGKEQVWGLYLTGAVISSFGSLAYRVMTGSLIGSCGASGAILALVTTCIMNNPTAQVSFIFLPMFQFPAGTALAGLVAFDFFGVLMRWRFLDHAGHLAGVLTGLAWHHYWPTLRVATIEKWERIKRH